MAQAAEPAYDVIFKSGVLSDLSGATELHYAQDRVPEPDESMAGEIVLSLAGEDAALALRQDDRHRALGTFPASVGNPVVMLFLEYVARDMSMQAGGSPFYIRNRLKDALLTQVDPASASVDFAGQAVGAQTVTLHPFAGDPNAAAMSGFDALEIAVTVSPDAPGWYLSLAAGLPDGAYRYVLTLDEVTE